MDLRTGIEQLYEAYRGRWDDRRSCSPVPSTSACGPSSACSTRTELDADLRWTGRATATMTRPLHDRIPVAGPWVTDLEVQYVAEAAAERLVRERRPVGRPVRAGVRRRRSASATRPPCRTAPRRCTSPCWPSASARATRSSCRSPRGWPPPHRIAYVGATPVFADIDPDTWCISADSVERCITPADQGHRHRRPLRRRARHGRDRRRRRGERHADHRGRRAGHRLDVARPPGRHARRHRHVQLPRHQDAHDRRGRDARHRSHRPVRAGRALARPRPHRRPTSSTSSPTSSATSTG